MPPTISSSARCLTHLRTHNALNTMSKEFLGSNIPHILLVQSANEFVDQAIGQFGPISMIAAGGFALDRGINHLFKGLNGKAFSLQKLAMPLSHQTAWFRLGKSLAMYAFITSWLLAIFHLRNALTIKRTGSVDYAHMVGVQGVKNRASSRQVQEAYQENLKKFAKTFASGLTISAGILGITQALIHK